MQIVVMLSVADMPFMLNVIVMSVVMLNVFMLNVAALSIKVLILS